MISPPISLVDTPQRGPGKFELPVLVLELDIEGLGKVLAQEMTGACLQGLAVLHHRLDALRVHGSGELLPFALGPGDDRHGHPVLREGTIDLEHAPGLFLRFRLVGMGGVAFLPEKLGRAQKEPRTHLPANDVAPLIDQQRQIAIALDPVPVRVPDDRFGSGPHDQLFLELGLRIDLQALAGNGLEAIVRDDGTLLGKPLGHFLFLGQERLGNEEGEIGVDVPGILEHAVEGPLHLLPDGKPMRLDDHAAAHVGVLGQAGMLDDIEIPLGIILDPGSHLFRHDRHPIKKAAFLPFAGTAPIDILAVHVMRRCCCERFVAQVDWKRISGFGCES